MKTTTMHAALLTLGVDRSQVEDAVQVTLTAIMRLMSVEAYCKRMKSDFGIAMSTEVYNKTFDTGYYQKNVKLYLTWCAARQVDLSIDIRRAGRQFELKAIDRQLYGSFTKQDRATTVAKINESVELFDSPAAMDEAVARIVDELESHIGKFINKKLIFTTKGTGRDKEDIESDLQIAAIRGAYKVYPFQHCHLHMVNTMKSAIHNVGMNLIQQATTKSRQALVEERGEFVLLREGFDFYGRQNDASSVTSQCGIDGSASGDDCTTTNQITYSQLLAQVKGRSAQFLAMLAGHYSPRFSRYLKKNGINKDNDDWSQTVLTGRRTSMQRYYEVIAAYCKLPMTVANNLIAAYRHQLGHQAQQQLAS